MTATQVVAGVAAFVGILGVLLATLGASPRPAQTVTRRRPRARLRGRAALRVPMALAGGAVAAGATGWPVLGLAVAIGALGLPRLFGLDRAEQVRIDRLEAVEELARRLADVLAIGLGLEQAIQTAARTAPDAIAGEVATLAARLSARMPTERALRLFADEMDDATTDLVVAALILASRRRGPGVAAALSRVSESVAQEVMARRRIEADRARPRTTARAVTVITLLIVAAGTLNTAYSAPYGSPLGQIVLGAILSAFAAALWWMHSMTVTSRPARVLAPEGTER